MGYEQTSVKKGTNGTQPYNFKSNPGIKVTPPSSIMQHYRAIGNQAVQRMMESEAIQAKLNIGQPNDKYEQEADRVADQVMRMPGPPKKLRPTIGSKLPGSSAQQKCSNCEDSEELLQRKNVLGQTADLSDSSHLPPIVHDVIRSPGQPLDPAARAFMEPRFGYDFNHVRVHTAGRAARSAEALHARAYTVGHHVVFHHGQFSTATDEGRRLLAHELVHVTQQRSAIMRSETPVPIVPAAPDETCTEQPDWKRVKDTTRANMKRRIEKSGILDPKATRATQPLILMADKAIRDHFGPFIPNDRKYGSEKSVIIQTIEQMATHAQTPGDNNPLATAVQQTAAEVLEKQKEESPKLCLPEPTAVNSHVVEPILNEPGSGDEPSGVELAKNYAVARNPAWTTLDATAKTKVVGQHAFMGHILVHEAMHFYTHRNFEDAAICAGLQETLMEGAAEFFARQVIQNKLQADDRFKINRGTLLSEMNYVRRNFFPAGLPAAFFLGNTGAIGLNLKGGCPQEGAQSPKKGNPIDVDVLGLETKTGKDAHIARAAAAQEGMDIVVESLEDMIEKLHGITSGNYCIHCLSVFNHGSPQGQKVSSWKGKESQRSGFYLEWLDSPENAQRIGTLRSVFCADGFMRWLGCATAGVYAYGGTRTAEELKSERYQGHKFVQSFYQSEEDVALHGASTKIRGLEVLQRWADEVGVPIIAATDLTRMNEKGIVVKYGGSWLTVHPRK